MGSSGRPMTKSNFKGPSEMVAPPRFIQPHRLDAIRKSIEYLLVRSFLYATPSTMVSILVPSSLMSLVIFSFAFRLSAAAVAAQAVAYLALIPLIYVVYWPMLARKIEEMHGSVDEYNRPYLERLVSLQRQIEDPVFAAEVREAKAAVTAPEAVGVRFRRLRASAFFVTMFAMIAVLVVVVEKFVHGLATFPLMILLLAGAQWFIVPAVTKRMHRRRHPDDDAPAPRAHPHSHPRDEGGERES